MFSKLIGFLHFFANRRKSVKKMVHQKKNTGHRTSRLLNPGKAIAMAICSIVIVHFITLRVLSYMCEFACAVRMRRNN